MLPPEAWAAVRLSVLVGLGATALAMPFAVGLGYLFARGRFRGRSLLETALMLPLVVPPVVTGYGLLLLLGRRGLLGGALVRLGISIPFTTAAAVIAAAVMGFPLAFRACRLAFEGVDPRYAGVARSLGAGPLRAFLTVSLPLARTGLVAGAVLAFARGLGEFGATVVFAGNLEGETRTLPLFVYGELQRPGGFGNAWAPAGVSVLLALALMAAGEWFLRRERA